MGAWAGKRERPCPNLDHARSLDQSQSSSQRVLSDRSQQGKELPFPARYAFVSIRIRNLTPGTGSADLSSPLLNRAVSCEHFASFPHFILVTGV